MKNGEEKSEVPSDKPWHAVLARAHHVRVYPTAYGVLRLEECQDPLDTSFIPYIFVLVLM